MPSISQNHHQAFKPAKLISALAAACLLQISLQPITAMTAHAEPTVIVNNQDGTTQTNQNSADNGTPNSQTDAPANADPQVAPTPNSPFNTDTANTATANLTDAINQGNVNGNPDALANPNSLASGLHPSDADLSAANQKLLSQNAQLQRDVNDLETRVNVLINERSGQLFMYGAVSVSIALFLGFMLGWFIFGRRDRW